MVTIVGQRSERTAGGSLGNRKNRCYVLMIHLSPVVPVTASIWSTCVVRLMYQRHQIADLADRQLLESSTETPEARLAVRGVMHALTLRRPSAGRERTEERDATKRRFFSCGLCNGRVDKRSMAPQHRRTSNTRLLKYSDHQIGLIYLSDAACGNCAAAAGLQGFFTGVK